MLNTKMRESRIKLRILQRKWGAFWKHTAKEMGFAATVCGLSLREPLQPKLTSVPSGMHAAAQSLHLFYGLLVVCCKTRRNVVFRPPHRLWRWGRQGRTCLESRGRM